MAENQRNYGIDLLRIVSMMGVPVLHVLSHGGVLDALTPLSLTYQAVWLVEILALCAVNTFAMVSGYVGVHARWKWSGILRLYLTLRVYSLLALLLALLRSPGLVDREILMQTLFPVLANQYWYFTAYFGLYCFIPFLNRLLLSLNRTGLLRLTGAIVAVFSLLSFLTDPFYTSLGYSTLWLGLMYLLGGALRRLEAERIAPPRRFLLLYLLSAAVTWAGKFAVERVTMLLLHRPLFGGLLTRYISPTILLCAAGLVLCFAGLRPGPRLTRFVRLFAPAAFSVYLIHDNDLIRAMAISDRFASLAQRPAPVAVLVTLGAAAVIWLGCSLADVLRQQLFRCLRVQELCRWVDKALPDWNDSGNDAA